MGTNEKVHIQILLEKTGLVCQVKWTKQFSTDGKKMLPWVPEHLGYNQKATIFSKQEGTFYLWFNFISFIWKIQLTLKGTLVFLVSKWENASKNIRGTKMKTKKNKQYKEVLEKNWENKRNERKESKVKTSASLVVRWLRIHCQCRGRGFSPWSRKIPHAERQLSRASQLLSPCSRDGKPQLLKPAGSRACAPHN